MRCKIVYSDNPLNLPDIVFLYHAQIVIGMICPGKTGNLDVNVRAGARACRRKDIVGRRDRRRGRLGVSPVISSTIIIAITVVLGLSLWSFVTSEVNTSTESFASATSDYVNYVNERYVIVNMAFKYDDPNIKQCSDDSKCVTIWIHNFSEKDVRINGVMFGDSSATQQQVPCDPETFDPCDFETATGSRLLKANSLGSVTADISDLPISINFTGDGKTTYYATVSTDSGTTQVYYQIDK